MSVLQKFMRPRWASNPRPLHYVLSALPTELPGSLFSTITNPDLTMCALDGNCN